jgi:hypothetical protein
MVSTLTRAVLALRSFNNILEHEEVAMDWKDHTHQVGGIVTNLQALETVLRYFLLRLKRQQLQFPKSGDADAAENMLTSYEFLGELVDSYNNALTDTEKQFTVDREVVTIRDALTARSNAVHVTSNCKAYWVRLVFSVATQLASHQSLLTGSPTRNEGAHKSSAVCLPRWLNILHFSLSRWHAGDVSGVYQSESLSS